MASSSRFCLVCAKAALQVALVQSRKQQVVALRELGQFDSGKKGGVAPEEPRLSLL